MLFFWYFQNFNSQLKSLLDKCIFINKKGLVGSDIKGWYFDK